MLQSRFDNNNIYSFIYILYNPVTKFFGIYHTFHSTHLQIEVHCQLFVALDLDYSTLVSFYKRGYLGISVHILQAS